MTEEQKDVSAFTIKDMHERDHWGILEDGVADISRAAGEPVVPWGLTAQPQGKVTSSSAAS